MNQYEYLSSHKLIHKAAKIKWSIFCNIRCKDKSFFVTLYFSFTIISQILLFIPYSFKKHVNEANDNEFYSTRKPAPL